MKFDTLVLILVYSGAKNKEVLLRMRVGGATVTGVSDNTRQNNHVHLNHKFEGYYTKIQSNGLDKH